MEQKILVTGATGAQGGAVVRFLKQKGLKVKALLTPTPDDSWFEQNEIETVRGNFEDRESLTKAMEGITNVSLVYPLNYNEALIRKYTDNLVYAFKQHELQSIVFNTSSPLPPQKTGSLVADIKLEIYERFIAEKLPVITITPSFYLDNLTAPWSLPVIKEQGIISYPLPEDALFAWLSHYNLAQYTYEAILKPELIGKVFPIGGELFTGHQIAEKISNVLNKPVLYVYLKPEEFKKILLPQYGERVATEIASIYKQIALNRQPLKAFYSADMVANVFGIQLQSLDEWAATINWN